MNDLLPEHDYQVGGSLPADSPTYVERQADRDFYTGLKKGDLCYLFNCRQMGKSSLRVRTTEKLLADGFVCAVVDLSGITSDSLEEWYAGIINNIVNTLNLDDEFDFFEWWEKNSLFTPNQKLSLFFEKIILEYIPNNIVIFWEEIDNIFKLPFETDNFFAILRNCYEKRTTNPKLKRLIFALIGVTTPSDLIKNKRQSPFNIGQGIELGGLQLSNSQHLMTGFSGKFPDPELILKLVFSWTGGQPFLTQKLCKLVSDQLISIPEETEEESIEKLILDTIGINWQAYDDPQHFKTISDRILYDEKRSGRLISLYQEILESGCVVTDDSSEQIELRLSGLVVKRGGQLEVYNRLYTLIFSSQWIQKNLNKLRPYAESLNGWVASHYSDESRLLRGQALQEALAWSASMSLSDEDYQFLTKSQELDKREKEKALEAERQATKLKQLELEADNREKEKVLQEQALEAERQATKLKQLELEIDLEKSESEKKAMEAKKQAEIAEKETKLRKILLSSTIGLGVLVIFLLISGLWIWKKTIDARLFAAKFYINDLKTNSQLDALVEGVKTGEILENPINNFLVNSNYKNGLIFSLSTVFQEIRERNRLQGHTFSVNDISFSPDGKLLISGSDDRTIKIWQDNGQEKSLSKQIFHDKNIKTISFNPRKNIIASADEGGTIKLWNLDGSINRAFPKLSGSINSIKFSPNGQMLASCSSDGIIRLWNLKGEIIQSWKAHDGSINSINFSHDRDGKFIISGGDDRKIKLWIWNNKRYELKNEFPPQQKASITSVVFSPNNQWIASASTDNTVIIWTLDGKIKPTAIEQLDSILSVGGSVNSVQFSPNGQILATASSDKIIKLWNYDTLELLNTLNGHTDEVKTLSFSPNGKILASGGVDNKIILWDIAQEALGKSQRIDTFQISHNGKVMAKATASKSKDPRDSEALRSVTIFPLPKSEGVKPNQLELPNPDSAVNDIALNLNGDQAIIAQDVGIYFWSKNKKLIKELFCNKSKSPEVISRVSWSSDESIFATLSSDNRLKLWRQDGQCFKTVEKTTHKITDLLETMSFQFNPKEKIIASADKENNIILWDQEGNFIFEEKQAHSDKINALDFSKDGKILVSASNDQTIKVWRLEGLSSQNPYLTLLQKDGFKGHTGFIHSIAISPSNQMIASGGDDKTIRLWDLQGSEIITLTGHKHPVILQTFIIWDLSKR